MNATAALPLHSAKARALSGRIAIPGDKSVSHRALIFGAIAVGTTRIAGLLEGEDVLNTARALRRLGVPIERSADGAWTVHGVGLGGLAEPEAVLDLGNSGTGARLLMGLVATHPFTSFFTGDELLCRRPMARVTTPLRADGRALRRPRGRMPAACRHRHQGAAADRVSLAGAIGAGEVGGAARRPQRAGRDQRDRAGADARPHGEHAAPFRRPGRGIGREGRRAASPSPASRSWSRRP